MKRACVVLLLTLAIGGLAPRPAYAHIGLWDWLEELSGPGPFKKKGIMADWRFFCFTQTQGPAGVLSPPPGQVPPVTFFGNPFKRDPGPAQLACQTNHAVKVAETTYIPIGYFEVRGGRISTDADAPLFSDRKSELLGRTNAQMLQGVVMRQIDPALALGVGGGALWFSGTNVIGHPTKAVLTPLAVNFMPLKLFLGGKGWSGLLSLRFDELAILGHLTAKGFNSASTSDFDSKRVDLVSSFAITVDLSAFR